MASMRAAEQLMVHVNMWLTRALEWWMRTAEQIVPM